VLAQLSPFAFTCIRVHLAEPEEIFRQRTRHVPLTRHPIAAKSLNYSRTRDSIISASHASGRDETRGSRRSLMDGSPWPASDLLNSLSMSTMSSVFHIKMQTIRGCRVFAAGIYLYLIVCYTLRFSAVFRAAGYIPL